jgi:hypothetical protein
VVTCCEEIHEGQHGFTALVHRGRARLSVVLPCDSAKKFRAIGHEVSAALARTKTQTPCSLVRLRPFRQVFVGGLVIKKTVFPKFSGRLSFWRF